MAIWLTWSLCISGIIWSMWLTKEVIWILSCVIFSSYNSRLHVNFPRGCSNERLVGQIKMCKPRVLLKPIEQLESLEKHRTNILKITTMDSILFLFYFQDIKNKIKTKIASLKKVSKSQFRLYHLNLRFGNGNASGGIKERLQSQSYLSCSFELTQQCGNQNVHWQRKWKWNKWFLGLSDPHFFSFYLILIFSLRFNSL